MLNRFFKDADKKQAISWAFYDFANSAYALLILSFVFPIFFKEAIVGIEFGDLWWGIVLSSSILLGGILAPIVGAIADHDERRKKKFVLFSVAAIAGTAFLYFTGSNLVLLSALLFILTNVCFQIATILYDSFLANVSTKQTAGRITGLAWGFGYIGGIVAMLLLKPFYGGGFGGDLENLYRLTFPLIAVFFLVFALPVFIFLKEQKPLQHVKQSLLTAAKTGLSKVAKTAREVREHKNVAWFLLAFFFMNDALVTIFAFIPIYAKTTLTFTLTEIALLLVMVQVIGFPCAAFFGWLSDKRGPKKILLFTLVPQAKRAEFFGFNGFASKVSATVGPILFGAISSFTGNQRIAMVAILPFIVVAYLIFLRVKE